MLGSDFTRSRAGMNIVAVGRSGSERRRRGLGSARAVAALRGEAPGYAAAVAFLSAYLLTVTAVAPVLQAVLNLIGAGLAASYLWRKGALPNVLLNVAWAAITITGLLLG